MFPVQRSIEAPKRQFKDIVTLVYNPPPFHARQEPVIGRFRIRPIYVDKADRVRAHVFLCMLTYYLEWHLRRRLAPMLFQDDDPAATRARRNSPVEKAEVSDSARSKAETRLTAKGRTVHSFATLTLNDVTLPRAPGHSFPMPAMPTVTQQRAFQLLDIYSTKFVSSTLPG